MHIIKIIIIIKLTFLPWPACGAIEEDSEYVVGLFMLPNKKNK